MGEGGIIRVKSYQRAKKVKLVQVELEDADGVPVFPRILVEDLNTRSQFWAHLGENDERNHNGCTRCRSPTSICSRNAKKLPVECQCQRSVYRYSF